MKQYGVKELTLLSGVSIRTLHYYDKIGLLKPAQRSEAGYRYYGEQELLRLQQILFFRELDFPLKEIKEMLEQTDFDMIQALESQQTALKARRKRISQLLKTIDHTLNHLKSGDEMTDPGMLYEGLPKEFGESHREEAIEKYGRKAIELAEKELMKLGKEGFEELKKEFEAINKTLFSLREKEPDNGEVQELIARHYAAIRAFWGTSEAEDKQAEAYEGLGQLYLSDERYTSIDGEPQPEFAQFLAEAMGYFATHQLTS